jgi:hypothetical protein
MCSGIYPFLLGFTMRWHRIVHYHLLWFLVFLLYQLCCLLFHLIFCLFEFSFTLCVSVCLSVTLGKDLSVYLFKWPAFHLAELLKLVFNLSFMYLFFALKISKILSLACCFSSSLRCNIRLFIEYLCLLKSIFIVTHFLLGTAFAVSHRL